MGQAQVVAQFTACVARQTAGSGFVGAKSISKPMDAVRVECDDIETARRQRAAPRREEMLRGVHESRALSRIHTRRRMREASAASRPYFDEHERAAFIGHDEIDLAAATPHVARDETHALPLQMDERARFENIAERFGHGISIKVVDGPHASRVAK